ncbi:hypothetical protein WDW37_18785 [Bdellovibrionota bacterium FG-1]
MNTVPTSSKKPINYDITKKMAALTLAALLGELVGCSTVRTKYSDINMRVMIDPDSIDEANYAELTHALVHSNKWTIVDRGAGFKALKREQERQHRGENDRFDNKEKWSHWGKLYGVGSVVVGRADCQTETSSIFKADSYLLCTHYLSIIDTNTGEIISSVKAKSEGENGSTQARRLPTPIWDEAVQKLNESYPEHFLSHEYHERVKEYQVESKSRAKDPQKTTNEIFAAYNEAEAKYYADEDAQKAKAGEDNKGSYGTLKTAGGVK